MKWNAAGCVKSISARKAWKEVPKAPLYSSLLPLSREGWVSYGLIGREIISDAIRARTQPRRRVITVKARLPSLSLSLSLSLFSHHLFAPPSSLSFSLFLSLVLLSRSIEETIELPILAYTRANVHLPISVVCCREWCIQNALGMIETLIWLCKEIIIFYNIRATV